MLNAKSNENANSEVSPAHTSCKGTQFGKVIRLFKSGENYVKNASACLAFYKASFTTKINFFSKIPLAFLPWSTSERDHKKPSKFKCSQTFWENITTSL